jgi:hypothetical protein
VKVLGFLTRAVLPADRGGGGDDGAARVPGTEPLTSEAYQMGPLECNRRYEERLAIGSVRSLRTSPLSSKMPENGANRIKYRFESY